MRHAKAIAERASYLGGERTAAVDGRRDRGFGQFECGG